MEFYILEKLMFLRAFKVFDYLTLLGDAKILIIIACIFYWKNTKAGLKLFKSFFMAANVLQLLKLLFAIPRPFVAYKKLKPSAFALKGATGFSFPSGHSQSSMSVFGFLALHYQKAYIFIIPILVAFSRLVLGVHFPKDAIFGLIIAMIFLRYEKGNLFLISIASLFFAIFRYVRGVDLALIKDAIIISSSSLVYIMYAPKMENKDIKLNIYQIILGFIPIILILVVFSFFKTTVTSYFKYAVITMFILNYPEKIEKVFMKYRLK